MLTQKFSICSILFALTARTLAQCSDPCTASDDFDDSDTIAASAGADFNEDLTSAIGADNGDLARRLLRRQDSLDVCCSDVEECAVLNGVPFCYDDTTTEFRFGDGTFGFIANSSYYDADGSYIDLTATGTSSAESPAETSFSDSPAAATQTADSTATSVQGRVGSETFPTGEASVTDSPATSAAVTKSGHAQGQSTHAVSSKEPKSSSTSVAKQTAARHSGTPNGGQNIVGNVGFGKVVAAMGVVMACTMGISHFA